MGHNFDELPETIKEHLRSITESSGLPDNEESLAMISNNWFEKKDMFEEQIHSLDMIEVDFFAKDDKKGALMLTYSGSLISLGTLTENGRWVEYSSIKLRSDVPDIVVKEDARLGNDTAIDKTLDFEDGPIKSTSSLLKIVVCKEDVDFDEQDMRIKEATIFLTNGFMKINRTLSINEDANIGQFTMKSIINYIAKRNGITINRAKTIVDDYIYIIESGMLLGEKVPIGRLGRINLKLKPAQKARVGRNPSTGEKITIKAKPEMFTPRMAFSRYLKEKTANAKIDKSAAESDDGDDD